jgi:hypothetical protein
VLFNVKKQRALHRTTVFNLCIYNNLQPDILAIGRQAPFGSELNRQAKVHLVDDGHFSFDTTANEIAARVAEFARIARALETIAWNG